LLAALYLPLNANKLFMLKAVSIQVGQQLELSTGTYQIDSEIGTGGFGTVYKARKKDADYAIKLNRMWELLPADREDIRKRIKQEYEISNTIHSAYLVHAFSYDELHENPVLIMEYCPDGNLRKRIGTEFAHSELVNISTQILSGLNTLHAYDIIHRDVKPENILFKKGVALLTDFGISANLKSRVTRPNIMGHARKVFATLSYSPPEQSQKDVAYKQTGPTNDIFSFGVILYEMITRGSLPFGSIEDFQTDAGIIDERKNNGEWDVQQLVPRIKNQVWIDIISRCLVPDPMARFQSATEIQSLLQTTDPQVVQKVLNWKLIVLEGDDTGRQYNLTNLAKNLNKRILSIGRYIEGMPRINDISISEKKGTYISKHHGTLEFEIKDGQTFWYIRDGQWYEKNHAKGWYPSTNGIKVNDKRIDQSGIQLSNNDIIKIGKVVYKIICE